MKISILIISIFSIISFLSCNEEKDDEFKRMNVVVNHSYNPQTKTFTVSIENKNKENVTINLGLEYYISALKPGEETEFNLPYGFKAKYVYDEIKMEAQKVTKKEYPLYGYMPHSFKLNYKVH